MTTAHAARITDELPEQSDVAPESLQRLEEMTGGSINVGLTLLHHPALARGYEPFGFSFFTVGVLPVRDRELIILRTSWLCDSPYEWAHHTRIGQTCGVSQEEIRRMKNKDLAEWDAADADLLSAVDSIVREHTLTARQWASLSDRYDTAGAIEIVMLTGHYAMLAGVLNSAGTQIERGIDVPIPLG